MQDNFLSTFLSNNRGIIKVRLIYIYKRIIPKFQTFPKSTTIFRLRLKPQYRQINVSVYSIHETANDTNCTAHNSQFSIIQCGYMKNSLS